MWILDVFSFFLFFFFEKKRGDLESTRCDAFREGNCNKILSQQKKIPPFPIFATINCHIFSYLFFAFIKVTKRKITVK